MNPFLGWRSLSKLSNMMMNLGLILIACLISMNAFAAEPPPIRKTTAVVTQSQKPVNPLVTRIGQLADVVTENGSRIAVAEGQLNYLGGEHAETAQRVKRQVAEIRKLKVMLAKVARGGLTAKQLKDIQADLVRINNILISLLNADGEERGKLLAEIDARISARIGDLEGRVADLESRMDEVEGVNAAQNGAIDSLDRRIARVSLGLECDGHSGDTSSVNAFNFVTRVRFPFQYWSFQGGFGFGYGGAYDGIGLISLSGDVTALGDIYFDDGTRLSVGLGAFWLSTHATQTIDNMSFVATDRSLGGALVVESNIMNSGFVVRASVGFGSALPYGNVNEVAWGFVTHYSFGLGYEF